MGILFKLIAVLALILLIASLFTKSKAQRAHNRNRVTNLLLALIAALIAATLVLSWFDK